MTRHFFIFFLAASLTALGSASCGGDGRPTSLEAGGATPTLGAPCQGSETAVCATTLKRGDGLISCFRGVRHCEEGHWGACADGEVSEELDPRADATGARRPLALSTAQGCIDNPCDPQCMFYDENPTPDWGAGGAGSSNAGLPSDAGCRHGLCESGAGLDAACDDCTTTVCDAEPSCCDESNAAGWDQHCQNLVFAACASRLPERRLCEFTLFAENDLSLQRDSQVSGGTIGAGRDLSLQRMTSPVDLIAGRDVTLDAGAVMGAVYAAGSVTLMNGASASEAHEGLSDLSSLSIPARSVACVAPSATNHNTGGSSLLVSPGDADQYTISSDAGQVVLSGPGDYGRIIFSSSGSLVFATGGTYRFDNLNVTAANPTLLFPPGEQVIIETCTGLTIENGASIETFNRSANACASAASWTPSLWWYDSGTEVLHGGRHYRCKQGHDPHNLNYEPGIGGWWANAWTDQGICAAYSYAGTGELPADLDIEWYTNSTGTVKLGPGALGAGILLAPHATVSPQRGDFIGAIFAKNLSGSTEFSISPPATGDVCSVLSSGGVTACPVSTLPPLLNEPCSTGQDCQANHRCTEPVTASACSHEKCLPGDALEAGCDDCVARICAADPSCCNDAWAPRCVEQVATVCDAVCDDFACLHDPCETGLPLEESCDSCIATVCQTPGLEGCCSQNWSYECMLAFRTECGAPPLVVGPTAGGSVCDYSAYGRFELQTQSATLNGGWVGSPTSGSQNIANSMVNGHATSSGSLNAAGSTITGDLLSGSGSIASGTVLGTVYTGVPPSPVLPNKALTDCNAGADPRAGGLSPGIYRDVTVAAGETLTLSGGTYIFNSLTLGSASGSATLALPSDGSIVEINVCGNVDFHGGSSMTGLTQATAMYLSLYAEGYIAARGANTLYGFFIASGNPGWYAGPCSSGDPCNLSALKEGSIYLGANSTLYGVAAAGRRVDARGGSTIDSTGLDDLCELIWDPGGNVTWPACPVALTPELPEESGACVPNAEGYEDITCGGYDLALGVPCDSEIPVCNHGTGDFLGEVEVGYWELGRTQLSTETPTAADGSCTGTLDLPAGSCAMLACPALAGGSYSLQADPSHLLSECDTRRLDNWSVSDASSCGAASRTSIERYEANCPAEMSPLWGYLTWSATTPGSSSVGFSALSAVDEASIPTSPTYLPLGTAHSTPTDTQSCGYFDPDCPIDLSDALGLSGSHDPFIELQVEITGNSAVLHDWRLTYSCAFDQ